MGFGARQEEALRSALGRLPLSVFVVDDQRLLRPLNPKAAAMMESEGLRGDLLRTRPAHPLSRMVESILTDAHGKSPLRTILDFPSGRSYVVEPSSRSERGLERWLILLIDDPVPPAALDLERRFQRWSFTQREREAAHLMARGCSTEEICEAMEISPTTLKSHVRRILEKTASRSRTEFLARLVSAKAD